MLRVFGLCDLLEDFGQFVGYGGLQAFLLGCPDGLCVSAENIVALERRPDLELDIKCMPCLRFALCRTAARKPAAKIALPERFINAASSPSERQTNIKSHP